MSLPLPCFLTYFQDLDLLPERILICNSFILCEKSRICFLFKMVNLHRHDVIVYFVVSCQSVDKVLPRSRFVLTSGSKNFLLLREECTSSRFALIMQSFSGSLCNQFNRFLRSKNCRYTEDSVNAKDSILFDLVSVEDCEHFARRRSLLVRAWPMLKCSMEHVHLLDASTGCRTCENLRRHRHVSHPLLEQTLLRSCPRWRRR